MSFGPRVVQLFLCIASIGVAGCDAGPELTLPAEGELPTDLYGPTATTELLGNVVDVRVEQDPAQLARGGELWAKVGPYIYLFSPQTRELFHTYTGLAAVRVRTFARGEQVAQAMLRRETLNDLTWPEALQKVSRARLEGTEHPSYMEDLVEYGEDRADFEYSPRYVAEDR